MSGQKAPAPGFWIAIGVAIGAGLGVALDNLALGMGVGLALGGAMTAYQSHKAQGGKPPEGP